ncbi:MAG: efflux RND transporter periplasmic adaptor subunit [Bacteroidota bacterium]
MKSVPFTKIIFMALAGFALQSCSSNSDESSQQSGNQNAVVPAVEAVQARYGSLPLVERFSGTVRAENQVQLFAEVTGRVVDVFVENGAFVNEGDRLLRIDDQTFRKQLQQAEAGLRIDQARLKQSKARLTEAEARYNRTKQLADKQLSSDLELETLAAQKATAVADVELAQAQIEQTRALVQERQELLSRTIVRAPISGTIGQRNAEVGMQVNPNQALFMIGDLDDIRVEIILTEELLNRVSIGQATQIYVNNAEGEEEIIRAQLARISPFLNDVSRSTEAEIDVDNTSGLLKPGMFVPVDIQFGETEKATLIPTSALFTDPRTGEEGVFIATSLSNEVTPKVPEEGEELAPLTEPTQVVFKPVDVVAAGRMELGVTGLVSGDWVITLGQDLLSEGRDQARVRVQNWNYVIGLQRLQREDLLRTVLNKPTAQQTL